MTGQLDRRTFLTALGATLAAGTSSFGSSRPAPGDAFRISLAQWSLHRDHFGNSFDDRAGFQRGLQEDPDSILQGPLAPLDFPKRARELGFDGVEYVNTFFFGHAEDEKYLGELRQRCRSEGVESLLIMCDAEGALGAPDAERRSEAVENHRKWLHAAKSLGCHSIRVNAASSGSFEEQQKLAADGLRALCEIADPLDLNVLVENHGGLSSNAAWLVGVMERVDHRRIGTLPDFGNFNVAPGESYDRYQGVEELMPWAKAVSAKSYDFDDQGEETTIDYERMLEIVLAADYSGWIGVEYEGSRLGSEEGILATRQLLERLRDELAAA